MSARASPDEPPNQSGHASHGGSAPGSRNAARKVALAVGAIGVVYGDIGTSPLYALRECFHGLHAIALTSQNVLGVLSLIFWSLTSVVAFKYLVFILRADNRGEGGVFALLALVPRPGRGLPAITLAALVGAAMLYGDGIITPAISVLSAIEGIGEAAAAAQPLVIPLTIIVLIALFSVQRRGTGRIGAAFGPVMLLWFLSIAVAGVRGIAMNPGVLAAINPLHAVHFFANNGIHGIVVLGSVVLAVTGAEALYADLGHFGRGPIRLSWFAVVFPSLLINYFGQGGLILAQPSAASNPFYSLVPEPLLYPAVALATAATVIASQAMISGVFSLTRQAIQLGFLPRSRIVHTSGETAGQIYIPSINRMLMVACIALVLAFQQSSRLAAAYGIAMTANMVITSILFLTIVRRAWKWKAARAVPLVLLFLFFDIGFFGSALLKVEDGGWFPLAVAAALVAIMMTWRDGRALLARQMAARTVPLKLFVDDLVQHEPYRLPGTAVFMSSAADGTPLALLHFFKHTQVLHKQIVVLSILSTDQATLDDDERVEVEELGHGFFRVRGRFGFMESPNVPHVLKLARAQHLKTSEGTTSYFLGRETLLTSGAARMANWRKVLFGFLSRNAEPATAWFGLPPGRVVELGMQIEL